MSRMKYGVLLSFALLPQLALAGPSEKWRAATFEEFSKGELENTVVTSQGEVKIGMEATALPIPPGDTSLIWSSLALPDGTVYLGTGNNGVLLKYSGGKVEEVAKTEGMILTALADAGGGAVYAGSLPSGKIFKIDAKGKVSTFADLDAEHVWGLAKVGQTLYAATGPSGALYAIDASGKAKIVYDSNEEHLLSLATTQDGALLAGTSSNALLLKISPNGKATALWDFEGQEIRAIKTQGDDIFVAVNTVSTSTTTTSTTSTTTSTTKGGTVFRISKEGRVEELYQNKDTYFTDLEITKDGLYIASGTDGKIYKVDPEERTTQVVFDVPERQVLTLHLNGKSAFFGCGDAATLYRVSAGLPKKASYFTDVIDAKYSATFGKLYFAGQGKLSFRTRSGNTEKPDATWSDWSAPQSASGSTITSPPARYLQVRFDWGSDPNASISRVDVYYQPQNQRALIEEIAIDGGETKSQSTSTDTSKRKITWKTHNPDKDELYAYLWYKAEGESNWKPLNNGKRLENKSDYTWETDAVPDGYYQIKLLVTDASENPPDTALSTEKISAPFLIDNGKPLFSSDLTISGLKVSGKVEDSFSPIRRIEYSIDGGEWELIGAADGIFDDKRESFSFTLPALPAGSHTVAIRAQDSAGNVGIVRKQFNTK